MVALSRNLPRKQSMEMLLTGSLIDASAALRYGLINRVVSQDRLEAATAELAAAVASSRRRRSPLESSCFTGSWRSLEAAYELASETMTCNMMTEDAQAGIDAFITKQPVTRVEGQMSGGLSYSDDFLQSVLSGAKTIAVVGASPNPLRASHSYGTCSRWVIKRSRSTRTRSDARSTANRFTPGLPMSPRRRFGRRLPQQLGRR